MYLYIFPYPGGDKSVLFGGPPTPGGQAGPAYRAADRGVQYSLLQYSTVQYSYSTVTVQFQCSTFTVQLQCSTFTVQIQYLHNSNSTVSLRLQYRYNIVKLQLRMLYSVQSRVCRVKY